MWNAPHCSATSPSRTISSLQSTTRATSALSIQPEQELLIGDAPETFAEQVIRLLRNPALGERLGKAGRRYVERNHDWNHVTGRLEGIYTDVLSQ